MPSEDLHAILGENAARCYGLDLADLQRTADRIGPREAALRAPVSVDELPLHPKESMVSRAFRQARPWR